MTDNANTDSAGGASRQNAFQRFKSLRARSARLCIVAAIIAVGGCLTWFEPQTILLLREWVWDEMVRAKPRAYNPDLNVRIVDIDEASLATQGQWPWPRARIARLVATLDDYGAGAVAFDVFFAEPDRTTLRRVFESLQRDVPGYQPPLAPDVLSSQPDNDEILAAAMTKIPVVLALSVEDQEMPGGGRKLENLPRIKFERRKDQRYLPYFPSAISALPRLQKQAAANASIDPRVDADGITRKAPLLFKVGKRTVPALSLAVAHIASDKEIKVSTRRPGLKSISVGDIHIPTDLYGQMRLYDSGTQRQRYISAADVLSGTLPKNQLKGAIVIVGTGAEGLNDLRLTPLDRWVPGMETHVQFVEQILSGSFLDRPEWGRPAKLATVLIFGVLLLTSIYFNWARVPSWSLAVFAALALSVGAWIGFSTYRLLLDPLLPAAALLSAAALDRFLLVLELRRERSAVRGAFARYLAPAVVEQLAENSDRLRLGGERREMTFLFCDIRGFTAISEQFRQDPEELTNLINSFLTPMTDEIMARLGTIDKYMGDCIMAFWNAPLDDPMHAIHACQSALAMQACLKELNANIAAATEETNLAVKIKAGVGLNTGNCVVGNMGSEQRFDYSVLGDDVNLASRLEGQSKTYGVDILTGEGTRAAAPDFAALEVDLIAVKGRTAAVHVYALLGDLALRNSVTFQQLAKSQNAILSAYRTQQWTEARGHIRDCQAIALAEWALTDLYELYEARISGFETTPPPKNWAGVYVADSK